MKIHHIAVMFTTMTLQTLMRIITWKYHLQFIRPGRRLSRMKTISTWSLCLKPSCPSRMITWIVKACTWMKDRANVTIHMYHWGDNCLRLPHCNHGKFVKCNIQLFSESSNEWSSSAKIYGETYIEILDGWKGRLTTSTTFGTESLNNWLFVQVCHETAADSL